MAIRRLKLTPRLWENALRRIPLLTNSATNCCTAARVRRLDADNLFSTVIQLAQQRQVFANRCVGQTLTFERAAYRNGQKISLALLPALARAPVTLKHRQAFLNAVVQIWQNAIAMGELANRAIGPGFPSGLSGKAPLGDPSDHASVELVTFGGSEQHRFNSG
jgi:hypothetical protein